MQAVDNHLSLTDDIERVSDPLALDIPDKDLEEIVKQKIATSQRFFEEKYNLSSRRKKNETYLFGRQIAQLEQEGKLKDYETRSSDNVLYEIEASLKPLAMAQLPDIMVTPGGEDPEREESARNLTIAIDDMNKKREQRMILGLGFKHLPVYFTAVIKARWDADQGKEGDFKFEIIHPEYIVVDHTCVTKNPDDMGFIAQMTPMTIQELIMKFPSKKKEIIEQAKVTSAQAGEPSWKDMATEVKPWEVWFDWYKRKGKNEMLNKDELVSIYEPGVKWERISGVLWKFGSVILDKMLDPNFDHVGEDKFFTYADPSDEATKQEVDPKDMLMAQLMGQPIPNLKQEKVYHNYFDRPHKPYYFYGYDQWGKVYLDETSRLEQNVRNQENLDDQNKEALDQIKTRTKHIWSKDTGMDAAAVQKLDMDDPKLDALVEGNPNEVHAQVTAERPDPSQFQAINDTRERMKSIAGTQALAGELQSDVATNNQMGRENNFTRTDDLVEDTINSASEWMAGWQMQYIKLRYTSEHLRQILGAKGNMTYIRLRRDTISDGMEVMIKSSSTDKLKAQRNAMETAKIGAPLSNPLDFFRDMDMNDPEGRTERGIMFQTDPQGYFAKYILQLNDSQMQAAALQAQPMPGQPPAQGQPQGGQPVPQNPSPQDTTNAPLTPPTGAPAGSPRNL